MYKVSIIMPVYNSEQYLRTAVESVLEQDFSEFELILVDDGSPDQSGCICDEYAEKNQHVKVIHKENGGICSARNAGLDVAQGEYVGFCDNDDLYLPHLLRDNYVLAKEHGVDLMRYAKIRRLQKADGRVWETISPIKDMFIEKKEFYQYYQNIRREDTIWTGLYRREILETYHIRFDENFKYGMEDWFFNLMFLKHCDKLGFNSTPYYSWTQRESHSTSKSFHVEYLENSLINMDLENDFMTKICENKVDNVMKNIFLVNSYIYSFIDYMSNANSEFPMKEKVKFLDKMRNHPLFCGEISKSTFKQVRRENIRVYITMKLFYERKFRALIVILDKGTRFLSRFRYK